MILPAAANSPVMGLVQLLGAFHCRRRMPLMYMSLVAEALLRLLPGAEEPASIP